MFRSLYSIQCTDSFLFSSFQKCNRSAVFLRLTSVLPRCREKKKKLSLCEYSANMLGVV